MLYTIWVVLLIFATCKFEWCQSTNLAELSPNEKKCFYQCYDKSTLFQQCMANCTPTWLFVEGSCSVISEISNNSTAAACNPDDANVEVKELHVTLPATADSPSKVVPYLYLSWIPCPYGIDDLTGYVIVISRKTTTMCFAINLRRHLTPADHQITMSTLIPKQLKSGATYEIILKALPYYHEYRQVVKSHRTTACSDLNGFNSCICDYDFRITNVSARGYNVDVTFMPARACFQPEKYDVSLCSVAGNYCHTVLTSELIPHTQSTSPIHYTFTNVFNGNDCEVGVQIVTITSRQIGAYYNDVSTVEIEAWHPPKPNVTEQNPKAVLVSFQLPALDHRTPAYVFRAARYKRVSGTLKMVSPPIDHVVQASSASNGILSNQFYLDDGYHGFQIREVRPNITGDCYSEAMWSEVETFDVKTNVITIVASVVGCISFLIILCLCALCLIASGKCRIESSHLPPIVKEVFKRISFRQMTVLLVWQRDHRSPNLDLLYQEAVRAFGSYLALSCGLDVVLDQNEQIKLSSSYVDWISKSTEKAEAVIFVCPHFDYTHSKEVSCLGNFDSAFKYMANEIRREHRRFVTVAFPFSDLNMTTQTKYLHNLTATFNIMDEIEDLYFYIQGVPKKSLFVKNTAINVNGLDYRKTPAGKHLEDSLLRFRAKLSGSGYERIDSSGFDEDDDDDSNNRGSKGNACQNLSASAAFDDAALSAGDGHSTPLMVNSFIDIVPPNVSVSPSRKIRSKILPPDPVAEGIDVDQTIRMINEASRHPGLFGTVYLNEEQLCESDVAFSSHSDCSFDGLDQLETFDQASPRDDDESSGETSPKSPMSPIDERGSGDGIVMDGIRCYTSTDSGVHSANV